MVTVCVQCGRDLSTVRRRSVAITCSETCARERRNVTYRAWLNANRSRERQKFALRIKLWRERNKQYFKDYYAANKERRKLEASAWYRANALIRDRKQREYAKTRRNLQPEHVRNLGRRSASKRRAIKKQVFIESVDPVVVFTRDNGICGICKSTVDRSSKWEVDHVIPLSKGGVHSYDNVQLAHRRCNRSKSASLPTGQPNLFQVMAR